MKFKVALYPSEEGFAVSALNLPGCWSQGETEEEAVANIIDAIREFLEAEIEPEPEEGAVIREVEVSI
jgi:predicted RNase H-like HicB family nuclease